jgi:hypothetical protein
MNAVLTAPAATFSTQAPTAAELITSLEGISDEFNRKLGKLSRQEHMDVLEGSLNFYGLDASSLVSTMVDKMFSNDPQGRYFTYGITNYIEVEITRIKRAA